jgi:hypothetical protein
MTNEMNLGRLAKLCAQIERAWFDHRDRLLVENLSEQYPEFREELTGFFTDLVLGEELPAKEQGKADERIRAWLDSSGFDIAMKSLQESRSGRLTASSPCQVGPSDDSRTCDTKEANSHALKKQMGKHVWVLMLKTRTSQKLECVASKLTHVTKEYLVLVSRYPSVVPWEAKSRIVEEVEKVWGVSTEDSFACLAEEPQLARAASRSQPFGAGPANFTELLDRAALSEEQKKFWLRQAKSNQ